jgi:hypothetical protein
LIGAGAYLILRRPTTSTALTPPAAPTAPVEPAAPAGLDWDLDVVDVTPTPAVMTEPERTPALR